MDNLDFSPYLLYNICVRMSAVWWIIIGIVVAFLIDKIIRGFLLTARCRKILRQQREKLKEEGLLKEGGKNGEGDSEGR